MGGKEAGVLYTYSILGKRRRLLINTMQTDADMDADMDMDEWTHSWMLEDHHGENDILFLEGG